MPLPAIEYEFGGWLFLRFSACLPKLHSGLDQTLPRWCHVLIRGGTTMTRSKTIGTIAVGALTLGSMYNAAPAQQVTLPEGRVYVFHSKPTGACPALDWHVVVGANNALSGMIAWDDMKAMASVSGSLTPDRTFSMTAKEVGGQGRTAMVSGTLRTDGYLIATVKGPKIECDNITVPWFVARPPGGNG
jgi:hypothetical protein